jgi:hypothetical protein
LSDLPYAATLTRFFRDKSALVYKGAASRRDTAVTTSAASASPQRLKKTHKLEHRPPFDSVALLLQGGGALGAYQAGAYEALARPIPVTVPRRFCEPLNDEDEADEDVVPAPGPPGSRDCQTGS